MNGRVIPVLSGALLLASSHVHRTEAQVSQLPTEVAAIRFNAGQSVVPYFEGWIPKPDGTFDMVFGYFNRNFKEEFAIPAGPDNKVEPGPIDGGQPTYFLARRQRYVFRVRVPKDFGKQEVVWTITSNGRTEKGYGNLIPAQEITERVVMTNGNFDPGLDDPNGAPSITIAPVRSATVDTPVTLTALVVDDGLPKPRVRAPQPTAQAGPFGGQINSSAAGPPRGLTVSWLPYRTPGKVTFAHTGTIPVANGQATTTARFASPGTYTLIVSATDPGRLSTRTEVTVTVTR
jgi:hypothetical protein